MPNYSVSLVKKSLLTLVFICFFILGVKVQVKQYFSSLGESCLEMKSYFNKVNKVEDSCEIYYTSNRSVAISASILIGYSLGLGIN